MDMTVRGPGNCVTTSTFDVRGAAPFLVTVSQEIDDGEPKLALGGVDN